MSLVFISYALKEKHVNCLKKVVVITKGEINYISKSYIIDLIESFKLVKYSSINLKNILENINYNLEIHDIRLRKKWPDQMVIELDEYRAKAYWNSYDKLLLGDQKIITLNDFSRPVSLPIFYATNNTKMIEYGYKRFSEIAVRNGVKIRDISFEGNQWQVTLITNNGYFIVWLGSKMVEKKLSFLLRNYRNIKILGGNKLLMLDMRYYTGVSLKTF